MQLRVLVSAGYSHFRKWAAIKSQKICVCVCGRGVLLSHMKLRRMWKKCDRTRGGDVLIEGVEE